MAIRVLHVTPYFAPAFIYGGPPRSVLGLCKALRAAGVDAAVATTSANGDGELPAETVSARAFEGVPVRYCRRSFPKGAFRSAELARHLRESLGEFDLAHLHGCWNFACWQAGSACRSRGLPYVLAPRGMLEPWSFERSPLKKRAAFALAERANLAKAAALHATTEQEAENLRRFKAAAPIAVIPNGLDLKEFDAPADGAAFRRELGIDGDELVVLFLSRVHPKKGLEVLGEAFERALKEVPRMRLVIAGDGERDYVDSLRRRFAEAVESREVIFAGQLDSSARLRAYAAADIFALASRSENFGLVIAEAMAAGKPVAISRECPWPEVEQWSAGLRVPNTPEDFSAALLRLARDPELRRRMGENGKREMFSRYGWPAVAAKMISLYESLLH